MIYSCKSINAKVFTFFATFLFGSILFGQTQKPVNIIFMIGDGMGVSQVTSAFYFGDGKPNFQNFKFVGLSETSSTSDRVTDSAAGATALSTGQKTYKRAIGVNKDSLAIPTILEQLQDKGYKTGLVCLTSITHATPAAYYAHVKDRDLHEDIALDFIKSDVDFAAGGGLKFFNKRKDNKDLLKDLTKKNYRIDTTSLSKPAAGKRNLYLMARDELPNKVQGRKDFLPEATQMALDFLSQKNEPFFLMVEGSFIDWGGHANNAEMMVKEVLDFDKTIGVVMDFIKKNPNTLLVVTADHETGGASIGKFMEKDASGKQKEVKDKLQVNFIDGQHTAALVPVFAMGKGEDLFSGVYPNNTIYHKLVEALKRSGVNIK
ncbi:alkaline phosphatase [Chryseobacterium taichungense]|uniref:alkaline phosphatase n=1 Tax=Chryseobacterium taichungense TaxID=295069 RepID=UPI0028A8E647|nr:alkaline phosphatase [Chryseobacterium taichungense]